MAQRVRDPPVCPLEDIHVEAITGQSVGKLAHQWPEVSKGEKCVPYQCQKVGPMLTRFICHGMTSIFVSLKALDSEVVDILEGIDNRLPVSGS